MSRWSSLALLLVLVAGPALSQGKPRQYGVGQPATSEQIAGWDIDVRPDGQGAPPGQGSVKAGEKVYLEKCAACHGEFGESAGRWPQLAQGKGTLASHDPIKTVGSYYPYLSSVFDYIRRAMPWPQPRTLSNEEVYSLCAYILSLNKLIGENDTMDAQALLKVKMPNRGNFIIKFPDKI